MVQIGRNVKVGNCKGPYEARWSLRPPGLDRGPTETLTLCNASAVARPAMPAPTTTMSKECTEVVLFEAAADVCAALMFTRRAICTHPGLVRVPVDMGSIVLCLAELVWLHHFDEVLDCRL